MKKAKLGLVALLLSHPVVAKAPEKAAQPNFFKSGPYAGFSFGYSYANANVKEQLSIPTIVEPESIEKRTAISNGVTGDLFAGYRQFLGESGYALGADFTVSINNHTLSKNIVLQDPVHQAPYEVQTPLTASPQFILAASFSKAFSPRWLGFVKAGINITRLSLTHAITDLFDPWLDCGTYKKTSVGPMLAAGGEYVISEKVSAVGTISYLRAQKFRQAYALHTFDPANYIPGDTASTTVKPYWVTAKISLLFRF